MSLKQGWTHIFKYSNIWIFCASKKTFVIKLLHFWNLNIFKYFPYHQNIFENILILVLFQPKCHLSSAYFPQFLLWPWIYSNICSKFGLKNIGIFIRKYINLLNKFAYLFVEAFYFICNFFFIFKYLCRPFFKHSLNPGRRIIHPFGLVESSNGCHRNNHSGSSGTHTLCVCVALL